LLIATRRGGATQHFQALGEASGSDRNNFR
jgi:hypothetical protein